MNILDETEAARFLGGDANPISTRTLQRMRLAGDGPPYLKLGRLVRYRESDLRAWLDGRARNSTAQAA